MERELKPLNKDERTYVARYVMNIKGERDEDGLRWHFDKEGWQIKGPRHDSLVRLVGLIVRKEVRERPEGGLMVRART